MALQELSFEELAQRICAGSTEAIGPFIELYGPHLQRVVRASLSGSMRAKFDSIDFVQMVWASLFTDPEHLQLFREPQKLYGYLVSMAKHKVIDESRRRLKYKKYNVRREGALETTDPAVVAASLRQDTPSQWLMARERFDDVMSGLSVRDREIFRLRMQGETVEAIALKMGVSDRTVRQIWSNIQAFFRGDDAVSRGVDEP